MFEMDWEPCALVFDLAALIISVSIAVGGSSNPAQVGVFPQTIAAGIALSALIGLYGLLRGPALLHALSHLPFGCFWLYQAGSTLWVAHVLTPGVALFVLLGSVEFWMWYRSAFQAPIHA